MKLDQLCDAIASQSETIQKTVLWIQGGQAPLCTYFFVRQLVGDNQLNTIDARFQSRASLEALCSVLFLGQSQYYCIKELSSVSSKARTDILGFLYEYKGPHKLICLYDDLADIPEHATKIKIDEPLTLPMLKRLHVFMQGGLDQAFLEKVFERSKTLPADTGFIISNYMKLLGRNQNKFFDDWLDRITPPDQSLFTLSQFFFAKDGVRFMELWQRCCDSYPDEFWIAFWSEQLWQALIYCQATSSGMPHDKRLVNRLPFSFLQRDWKRYEVLELAGAHAFLYDIDYKSKNGSGTFGLDLFCMKFLSSEFKKATSN